MPSGRTGQEGRDLTFHTNVFLKEFLYNSFTGPALPFVLLFEGLNGARNRLFWGFSIQVVIQYCQSFFFYAVLAVYFVYLPPEVSPVEVGLMALFMSIRAAFIGTKYALTPMREYLELNEKDGTGPGEIDQKERQRLRQMQIWSSLQPESIEHELDSAHVKVEVNLNSTVFKFEERDRRALEKAVSMLGEQKGGLTVSNGVTVNGRTLANLLLRDADYSAVRLSKWLPRMVIFLGIFLTVVPVIVRLVSSHLDGLPLSPFGRTPEVRFIVVGSSILTLLCITYFFDFLGIALLDMRRRRNVSRNLLELIKLGWKPVRGGALNQNEDMEDSHVLLDLRHPQNIGNWTLLRLGLSAFGHSFRRRLEMVAVWSGVVTLLLLIYIGYATVRSIRSGSKPDGVGLILAEVVFVIIDTFTCIYVALQASVNDINDKQVPALLRAKLFVQSELAAKPGHERLVTCAHLLETAIAVIDSENQRKDFKFLGIRSGPQTMKAVLTVSASVAAFAIRIILFP